MRYKYLSLLYYSLLMVAPISAQNDKLTVEANLISDSDEISLQVIPYFHTSEYGANVIWNFSNLEVSEEVDKICYLKDILGRHAALCHGGITYYRLNSDTLSVVREESPLSKIDFTMPLLSMHFPFAYGDSLSSPFSGYGMYCGDHPFRKQGVSTVKADAEGSIIMDDDTIHNVLRVYNLKSYSVCMDIDSVALDTARLKQVIEERYDWYARGYRYPLFTTVTSTSYDDATPLGTVQTAWCMQPDVQKQLTDSCNEDIRRNDSIALAEKAKSTEDIIHYSIA